MGRKGVRVAIGLPVYNGENFLAEAIASILGQTYGDFRLVISDNCSTDGTQDICADFARLDDRIEFHRQEKNIGGARNYNFAFRPDGAEYFKWAAHDDLLEPNYLAETVALLDADPQAVIAHGRSIQIDDAGNVVSDLDFYPSLRAPTPAGRLWRIAWAEYFCEVFGLMRTEAILKTRLHSSFAGSDRNFMADMLLVGNVAYSPEVIFRLRAHASSYVRKAKTTREKQAWFDPNVRLRMPLPVIRTLDYLKGIEHAQLSSAERWACRATLARWIAHRTVEETRSKLTGEARADIGKRIAQRGLVSLRDELANVVPVMPAVVREAAGPGAMALAEPSAIAASAGGGAVSPRENNAA
jgi:hypothetical protein